jgi:hypothetical protein
MHEGVEHLIHVFHAVAARPVIDAEGDFFAGAFALCLHGGDREG